MSDTRTGSSNQDPGYAPGNAGSTPAPVTCALTASQWAAREATYEHWGRIKLHSDGTLEVRDTVNHPSLLRGNERHALAALALHGQAFGFTREDVDALGYAAMACKGEEDAASQQGRTHDKWQWRTALERVNDLASRIAALLPPEPQWGIGIGEQIAEEERLTLAPGGVMQRCQRCGVLTPAVYTVDVALDKPVEYWCGQCAMTGPQSIACGAKA